MASHDNPSPRVDNAVGEMWSTVIKSTPSCGKPVTAFMTCVYLRKTRRFFNRVFEFKFLNLFMNLCFQQVFSHYDDGFLDLLSLHSRDRRLGQGKVKCQYAEP
jgi:hypothetical protein